MKKRPLLKWIIVLVVLVAGFWFWRHKHAQAAEQAKEPEREAVTIKRGDIRATVTANGVIQPETSVDIKANVAGEVTGLLVDVGDVVKPGDLVATIDPTDATTAMNTARAQMTASRANAAVAQSAEALERALVPAREREALAAVKLTRARLRQAEENYKLALVTSESDVATATANLSAAGSRLNAARSGHTRDTRTTTSQVAGAEQSVLEAETRVAQAETSLSYQQALHEAELTRARQARAAAAAKLESAKLSASTRTASASAGVRQAEAGLDSAKQTLAKLQAATQPQATAGAKGEHDSAKAAYDVAQLDVKRQHDLYDKGFVPYSTVEGSEVSLAAAKSRFESADEALKNLQEQQQAELASGQADVARAQAALDQAKEDARGSDTTKYDLDAAVAALAQAEADVKQAEAGSQQVDLKRRDLEGARQAAVRIRTDAEQARAGTLAADISAQDVAQAEASVRQVQAALQSALANRRLVAVRAADVQAARETLTQSEASFTTIVAQRLQVGQKHSAFLAARADITRQQASLQNAEKQMRDTIIRAPRAGVVTDKLVEEGTIITSGRSSVTAGTTIVTIADISKMYCNADVDESDVARLQAGQTAEVKVEAYPDHPFKGRVRKVYPKGHMDQNVTLFTVELQVDDPTRILRPAMTTEIEILTQVKRHVLVLPTEAVKEDSKGYVVQMDDGKGKPPKDVPIEIGVQTLTEVEVKTGLKEGDQVLLISSSNNGESGGRGGPGGGGGRSDAQRNLNRAMRSGVGSMRGGR